MSSPVTSLPKTPVRIELDAAALALLDGSAQTLAPTRRRIAAVVPCFNRPRDLELLLGDLAALCRTSPGTDLRIVVVDNASDPPLGDLPVPDGLDLRFLRLDANTGGSGGFNAGMAHALAELERAGQPWVPELLWLVDSDARVLPETLAALVRALDADPGLVAAGSAIAFPFPSGRVFEVGGRVHRLTGQFGPAARGTAGLPRPVECDYVAACSALVRADAVRRAGLMPDVFLNGDDVEWFIRLAQRTGGRVAGVPDSIAFHPTFDRFPTLPRYYVARNGFGSMDALGLGRLPRFIKAMREVLRALAQTVVGRDDLARLHLRGLQAAARGQILGPAPAGTLTFEPSRPLNQLAPALAPIVRDLGLGGNGSGGGGGGRRRGVKFFPHLGLSREDVAEIERQLEAAGVPGPYQHLARIGLKDLARRLLRPDADIAIVPARGRPKSWLAGRVTVLVTPGQFVVRRPRRLSTLRRAAWTLASGTAQAARIGLRGTRRTPMRAAPVPRAARPLADRLNQGGEGAEGATLGVVVLSHNRWPALRRTLDHLIDRCGVAPGAILVVDNASTDGTPAHLSELFPGVGVLPLASNRGVDAFNAGVREVGGDVVLVLDDDARPDPDALEGALRLLGERAELAAVTLHPRHPETGASEWAFAPSAGAGDDRWPVMGCANLVRREDWEQAGGYERDYFLYRNDTDLALKLLALGRGVHFNPDWTVWHDSPAAARKSAKWHRYATRNWIWTARRHGGGVWGAAGLLMGWAWAHRLAGASASRQCATLRGAIDGIWQGPPPLGPRGAASRSFGRLALLQLGAKRVVPREPLLAGCEQRVR